MCNVLPSRKLTSIALLQIELLWQNAFQMRGFSEGYVRDVGLWKSYFLKDAQLGLSDTASKLGNALNNREMGIPCRKCCVIWIASEMEIRIMVDGVMHWRAAKDLGCHQWYIREEEKLGAWARYGMAIKWHWERSKGNSRTKTREGFSSSGEKVWLHCAGPWGCLHLNIVYSFSQPGFSRINWKWNGCKEEIIYQTTGILTVQSKSEKALLL